MFALGRICAASPCALTTRPGGRQRRRNNQADTLAAFAPTSIFRTMISGRHIAVLFVSLGLLAAPGCDTFRFGRKRSADLQALYMEHNIQDQEDELAQLEAMYRDDELTDAEGEAAP